MIVGQDFWPFATLSTNHSTTLQLRVNGQRKAEGTNFRCCVVQRWKVKKADVLGLNYPGVVHGGRV